jgi:hypothetical protein
MVETSKKNRRKKVFSYKPFLDKLLESSNFKVLAIVPHQMLKRLDEKVGGHLGSHKRKVRPCLYWKTKEEGLDHYKIVFLTSSRITPICIDLSQCESVKKHCSWFHFTPRSFVIFDPLNGPVCLTLKEPEFQLTNLTYCGLCVNLESLDKL